MSMMNFFKSKENKAWQRTATIVLGILAVGGLLLGTQPAFAQPNCIQDVWKAHGNSQNLTCTANDVSLASVSNICIVVSPPGGPTDTDNDGCKDDNTCTRGANVTFKADFEMPLTAQARYDLGLYIASDGGGSDGALTGQCVDNIVTAANSIPATNFVQLDPAPDLCGDIDDTHNPQVIRQTVNATCSDPDGDGFLNLPWCTSWRQPGSNEVCDSTNFVSSSAWDAFPGSPSKCNCGDLNIEIRVEQPTGSLTKEAKKAVVTYEVKVQNDGTDPAGLDVNTLCDNKVGDISGGGGTSNPSCPAGVSGYTLKSTNCPSLPENIGPGGNITCQIAVEVPSSDSSQTNTVTAEVETPGGSDTFMGSEQVIVDLVVP